MKVKFIKQHVSVFLFVLGIFAGKVHAQNDMIPSVSFPSKSDVAEILKSNAAANEFLRTVTSTPIGKLEGFGGSKSTVQEAPKKPMDLLIFVSASMSDSLLRDYSKQAKELGAILVIRGFINGKQSQTASFIQTVNEGGAEWMIHPGAFKLFKVTQVPTIVLAEAGAGSVTDNGCAIDTSYTKISGDITLMAALDLFGRKSESKFATYSRKLALENQKKYEPKFIK